MASDVRTGTMLTAREREVMQLVARGYANKRIAYDLGVHESTVATWLCRGLRKIGGHARRRAITAITETRIDAFDLEQMTDVQREVLTMLVEGASNVEIARRRGRSVKTIANQVRAVYQKVGVGSRRELWAMRSSSAFKLSSTDRAS